MINSILLWSCPLQCCQPHPARNQAIAGQMLETSVWFYSSTSDEEWKISILDLWLLNQDGKATAAYFSPTIISNICSVGGALEKQELFLLHQWKINTSPPWSSLALVRNPTFHLGVTMSPQTHREAISKAKSCLWIQDHVSHSNKNRIPHPLWYPFPI